jgi:hypothetical protein
VPWPVVAVDLGLSVVALGVDILGLVASMGLLDAEFEPLDPSLLAFAGLESAVCEAD